MNDNLKIIKKAFQKNLECFYSFSREVITFCKQRL